MSSRVSYRSWLAVTAALTMVVVVAGIVKRRRGKSLLSRSPPTACAPFSNPAASHDAPSPKPATAEKAAEATKKVFVRAPVDIPPSSTERRLPVAAGCTAVEVVADFLLAKALHSHSQSFLPCPSPKQ